MNTYPDLFKKSACLSLSLALMASLAGCGKSVKAEDLLKTTEITLEYGSTQLDAGTLFDSEALGDIENLKADFSKTLMTTSKSYPSIGTYTLPITFDYQGTSFSQDLTLHVTDTTAPEISLDSASLTIALGDAKPDYASLVRVTDADQTTLEIDDSLVDYETPAADYTVQITASDTSKNSSSRTLLLTIEPSDNYGYEQDDISWNDNSYVQQETTAIQDPQAAQETSGGSAVTVNGILVVNKKHSLPADYAPGEDATAGAKVRQLIADMQSLGYNISSAYSGFRTYDYQSSLYYGYVASSGQAAADTFSARPGYSEHQTGLVFDLKHADGSLVTQTAEASWIAENAHKYGFIVRYQSGKEAITGYTPEPWHLRYVGEEAASAMYASGQCLEEYLGVEGGDYY